LDRGDNLIATPFRQGWIDAIRLNRNVPRLLYARGDAEFRLAPNPDPKALEAFFHNLRTDRADKSFLLKFHFLLQETLRSFIVEDLDQLLRTAIHAASGYSEVSRGVVKGRIRWGATTVARAQQRIDLGSFIVERVEPSWDTPENQLVKLLLRTVSRAAADLAMPASGAGLSVIVGSLRKKSEDALKHPLLREVSDISELTSGHILAAKRSKRRAYSVAADLQYAYEQMLWNGRWDWTLRLLSQGWAEPIRDDDLFELFVLMTTLDALTVECKFGAPERVGLIRSGRTTIADFRRADGLRASVFFDQSPYRMLHTRSDYRRILARHGLRPHSRRPDILVVITRDGPRQYPVAIECKNTLSENYVRASIYKVLGYLRDFKWLWARRQKPKILLAVPTNFGLTTSRVWKSDVLIVNGGDRSAIAEGLLHACAEP
jgi:hypothetical protein